MALPGMLSEVTQGRVAAHLIERDPEIVDDSIPAQLPRFEALVQGAAAQVVLVVGDDPIAGRVRNLAVEAIALEAASQIEYASFPEQQAPGDTGRGYHLHQRYLELLGDLRRIVDNNGGDVPDDGSIGTTTKLGLPRGRFPEPMAYPDPVVGPGPIVWTT